MNSLRNKTALPEIFSIILIVILLTVTVPGCRKEVRPATVPLGTLWYRQDSGGTHTRLFVLLPGRNSSPEAFAKNGFVEAVRSREFDVDLVAVDAHLGYYLNNSVIERLKEDVIRKAIADGYTRIWLIGISMGAMGSVYYMKDNPDDIDGMLLLGPYLGERECIDEIARAGGLKKWEPGELKDDDWQTELWQFLKSYSDKNMRSPVYVAYGTEDKYADGAELLTSVLPPERTLTVAGGHTWGAWRPLWDIFLDRVAIRILDHGTKHETHHQMQRHHSFEDIETWTALFESPERRKWQKPDDVINALNIGPGTVVADIGAGTGYFTRLFAKAVGPSGKALGLDTEPAMIVYMKEDARKLNLDNYIARRVSPDDPGLDPASVDLIFICNTLHHIADRINYLKRLSSGLRPKGRIVIVDFYKRDLPVGPPPQMKLRKDDVIKEFEDAGYRLIRSHDFLPYQYLLEFGL